MGLPSGIKSGLAAMRRLHITGHGDIRSESPGFPHPVISQEITHPSNEFKFYEIQIPWIGSLPDEERKAATETEDFSPMDNC